MDGRKRQARPGTHCSYMVQPNEVTQGFCRHSPNECATPGRHVSVDLHCGVSTWDSIDSELIIDRGP